MTAHSRIARVRAFLVKHWRSFAAALTALVLLLIAIFKTRKSTLDDTPTVPSGPTRAAQVHDTETRQRQAALAARAAQEAALQEQAELEAAAKLRAEEERLRRDGVDASTSAAAANAYADRVSHRKEGP